MATRTVNARSRPCWAAMPASTARDGTCIGCLCGAPMTRFGHTQHLAQLVDALVEAALDVAFANRAKGRSA